MFRIPEIWGLRSQDGSSGSHGRDLVLSSDWKSFSWGKKTCFLRYPKFKKHADRYSVRVCHRGMALYIISKICWSTWYAKTWNERPFRIISVVPNWCEYFEPKVCVCPGFGFLRVLMQYCHLHGTNPWSSIVIASRCPEETMIFPMFLTISLWSPHHIPLNYILLIV